MVDRVGDAIKAVHPRLGSMPPEVTVAVARAAIEALRYPTDAMRIAFITAIYNGGEMEDGWDAVLDAALNAEPEHTFPKLERG